jgi:hypothetical protein
VTARAQIVLSATDATAGAFEAVQGRLRQLAAQSQTVVSRFAGLGTALASLGAAAGLAAFARRALDSLTAIEDLAQATGASIENISALEDVAKRTGTSFETVGSALLRFNQSLAAAKPGSDIEKALTALGLSARELQRLDPAEALLQTGVALQRYADDGNKARISQELFGRSLREVAPLLNDIAERGTLTATVTAEQAKQAAEFADRLASLRANVENLSRSIVSDLLPSLNQLFERARREGFLASLFTPSETAQLQQRATEIQNTLSQVSRAFERAQALSERADLPPSARNRYAADAVRLRGELERVQQQALAANEAVKRALGGPDPRRAIEDRGFVPARPSLPNLPQLVVASEQLKRFTSNSVEGAEAFGAALRSIEQTDTAKLRALNEQLTVLSELQRETRGDAGVAEALASVRKAIADIGTKSLDAVGPTQAMRDALAALEDTNVVRIQQVSAAIDELFRLRELGLYGPEVDEAISRLREKLAELQKPLEQVSEFAAQAARNIQDALGDSLLRAMEGNFDSIGDLWKGLLRRMVAQAAAAQISRALFGPQFGATGQIGGLIGQGLDFLRSFGGFRADGGPVSAGRAYVVGERGPELMVPRGAGTVVPNGALGASYTWAPVINVNGSADTRQIEALLARERVRAMRAWGA